MILRSSHILSLVLAFLLLSMDMEAQCAMCRAVLESEASAEGQSVSRGVNSGILYLMGFPYLLMAGVAAFIFRDKIKAAFKKA